MKFLRTLLGSKHDDADDKSTLDNIFDAFGKKKPPKDVEFRAKLDAHAAAGAQRLLDVFNANVVPLAPDYVSPVHLKSKQESEFIKQALSGTFLFGKLGRLEKHDLIMAFEKYQLAEGSDLFQEGDKVEYFYILETGTVASTDGQKAGPGDFVGELALLYDYPSEATFTATTDSVFWRLDQVTFRKVLASHAARQDNETKALLKRVTVFEGLDDAILTKVAFALRTETYEKGDSIIRKGDECKSFYIVKEGTIKGTDIVIGESKYDDLTFKAGDAFGELAIMKNAPIVGNVTAEEPVTMLCLPRQVFIKLFGDMADLILRSEEKKKLRAIPVAGKPKLNDHELELLTSFIKGKKFSKGHVFVKQGYRPTNALYLMRSGKVSVRSSTLGADLETLVGIFGFQVDGETTTVSEGGYFGADTLFNPKETKAEPSPYTITAEEDCAVGVLTMEDILSVFASQGGIISLTELEMYRILGAGTFGKVWLCSKRGTKDAYALKVQNKRKMIDYGQVEGVVSEKNTMARLNHPFIIKLVSSFKDERSLYMLTALYQGGELRSVIRTGRRHGVPEQVGAFYAANILQGMSFMHDRHILHRDLKPENVLLNSEGYTVLVDLGFAKIVPDKTYTFCGTPTYIAPEVIEQKGYDKSADLWSWGVMVYEMIVGMNPFYEKNMSEMTLYKKIINGHYTLPSGNDFMSGESKSLIRQMLETDPRERLGSFAKAHQDIRDHAWFHNVDFAAIDEMKAKAPWVPKIKDPLDDGNFARWDNSDKEQDEAPLTAREQRLFDAF